MELEHQTKQGENQIPATTWLLLAGSSLIVIAIFVLVSSSWDAMPPLGRVLTACIPLVILYAIGFATRKDTRQAKLSLYTTLTASIITPFVVGVILWQSNLYRPEAGVDEGFIMITSLITLLWYIFLEFVLLVRSTSALTILATLVLGLSFASFLESLTYVYSLLAIIIAYFFLSIGWFFEQEREETRTALYTYSGITLGWLGVITLPLAYFQEGFSLEAIVLYAVLAVSCLLVAILYSLEYQRAKQPLPLQVRQVAERTAAGLLTLPSLLALLNSEETVLTLVAILLSLFSICLSTVIRVKEFRTLGILTFALAVVKLVFFAFTTVSEFWPIILLILGFLLIGLAYLIHQYNYRHLIDRLWEPPVHSWLGLGVNPDLPRSSSGTTVTQVGNVEFKSHPQSFNWEAFGLILAVLFFLYFLSAILSNLSTY